MKIVKEINIDIQGSDPKETMKFGLGDDGNLYVQRRDRTSANVWDRLIVYDGAMFIDIGMKEMKQILDSFWHLRAFL